MSTTDIRPLDERGRLLHEGDLVAQLALAVLRLEEHLAGEGWGLADLATLRVRLAAPGGSDRQTGWLEDLVTEVLAERFTDLGASPEVTVDRVPRLEVPGMLVSLDAGLGAGTLLVVVAHPDDEAFGCGSVLAHAAAHGLRTVVACATRGELGEPAPGSGLTRADLPTVRERELREACALLGVDEVEVLGYVDSGVDGPPAPGSLAAADPDELRDRVVLLLDRIRPDVVVTLDARDGHRDHAAVRDATLAALDLAAHRPVATYLSCLARSLMTAFTGSEDLGTPDEELTAVVDVADLLELRWRAIRTHASQVPPFDAMDEGLRHEFLAVDRLRRVDPPWSGGPPVASWLPTPVRRPAAHHLSRTTKEES